jgi:hypothetical protein
MMLIHKFLKTMSLTVFCSRAGPIIPERLITLAVTAFYLACKDLDLPISISYAAFQMHAVEQMTKTFGRPNRNFST